MKFNIELFEKAPIIGILRNINEETVDTYNDTLQTKTQM